MLLENQVAVVTGSSRGIGRDIARTLAAEGAAVVVNYASSGDAAADVVAEIEDAGGEACAVQADVSDRTEVKDLFAGAVDRFGQLDILVNNAGITRDRLLLRMGEDDWDDVLDVNLKGTFLCTKRAVRAMMRQRSGSIINISSIVGLTGNPGQANYTASKAGVVGFTKTVAREIGSRGVRVNAVAPGYIETALTDELEAEIRERMLDGLALGRLGTGEDVADVVAFLASERARYITGQVVRVDGGLML